MEDFIELLSRLSFKNDTWVLLLPAACIALDIFTGVLHAWIVNRLKSYRLREGLGKKCGELCAIILGELLVTAMNIPRIILVGISSYITFMEIISIFENFDKLGVPIPKAVKRALGVANDAINNDELSEDTINKIKEIKKGGKRS